MRFGLSVPLLVACFIGCNADSKEPEKNDTSTQTQGINNSCLTDPSECLGLYPATTRVTCYRPGTTTNVASGYTYSDSAGTDGANGFSGTNWGRYLVPPPYPGTQGTPLNANQKRDIRRFMNNAAIAVAGVPATTARLDHHSADPFPVTGGYAKWYPLDAANREDFLAVWNPETNCAYLMTKSIISGAVANIYFKWQTLGAWDSVLGLPTSNWMGNTWGVSWQRFTNGYITNRSTGTGDLTDRAFYVGGTTPEDKALAARYGKEFDRSDATGENNAPLAGDPECANANTQNPDCGAGMTGRFVDVWYWDGTMGQLVIARVGQSAAYWVSGSILAQWRQEYGPAQPWNGALGFPRGDQIYDLNTGAFRQSFDTGYIESVFLGPTTLTQPVSCSGVCDTSPSTTSCWDSTRGTLMTCGTAQCNTACDWASESDHYCYDGTEGNTNSTCGRWGTSRESSDCLRDPTHAGCLPLAQSGYADYTGSAYGICNDGSTESIVSNVSTRAWTALSGPSYANPTPNASSYYFGYPPTNATDLNPNTEWRSSTSSSAQWLRLSHPASYPLKTVTIHWGYNYPSSYKIQISNDSVNWTDVVSVAFNWGGLQSWSISGSGKYVRMYASQGSSYTYYVKEFSVVIDTEQARINRLMNRAASLIGCDWAQDNWAVSDINLDSSNQDSLTAAYVKPYANGPTGDMNCGEVYFNRALGCAFPIAKTDTPQGHLRPRIPTERGIFDQWSLEPLKHGLPTSLPQRSTRNSSMYGRAVVWQRFQNSYFTSLYPLSGANYLGGRIVGDGAEGRALAARYGRDFDYYSPNSPFPSLDASHIGSSTVCVNDTQPYKGPCGTDTTGLMGYSERGSYWIRFGAKAAVLMPPFVEEKYASATGVNLDDWQAGSSTSGNPTLAEHGLGWPTSDSRTEGLVSYLQFLGGKIYWKSGSPSWLVANTMMYAYDALGGPNGELGYPLEDTPSPFGDGIARTQRFDNGSIVLDVDQLEPTIKPEITPTGPFQMTVFQSNSDTGLPLRVHWVNPEGTTSTRVFWKVLPDATTPKPSPNDPGWTHVGTGANPSPDRELFVHETATGDAMNCYYIDFNFGAAVSHVGCMFPRGPRPDNPELRRIELRVKVADVEHAGTDDSVRIRLNYPNETWIDSTINDFERGSDHAYFLLPFGGLTKLTDITSIVIEVDGEDAVCISEIELYVNRNISAGLACTTANGCVFRKIFGNTNNTCKWVEDSYSTGKRVQVTSGELRASPEWNADLTSLMTFGGLDEEGLRQAAEGIAGHYMHGKPYQFENGHPLDLVRVQNSLFQIADTSMEIHAHLETGWIIDAVAKTQISLEPQYYCWNPRDEQITMTEIRITKPQANTSLDGGLLNFLNLVWWPAVDPAIKLYLTIFKHDRIREVDVAPPADHHYCFPVTGTLVNGVFACNNDADNVNFPPELRTPCKTVTARLGGNQSGYVDTLPASSDIQCGNPPYTSSVCLHPYNPPYGDANEIYLRATALPGSVFTGWIVDLDGRSTGSCVSIAGAQGEFCYVNTADNPIVTATFGPE